MSAPRHIHAVPPLHRFFSRSQLWIWSAILLSVLVCVTVSWLHVQQRQTLQRALSELENIRQARIDLGKGFLHISLAGGPDSPFGQAEGLALLQQAISSFDQALAGLGGVENVPAEDFRRSVAAFESRLSEWKRGGISQPGKAVAMRITFNELERQADGIDTQIQRHLRQLSTRLDRRFNAALGAAALLLAAICGVVFYAGRIKDTFEAASRESEDRFRQAMEATNDGLWDWNAQTHEVYYSPGYWRMLGYEPDEFTGKFQTWADLLHPDDRDRAIAVNQDCLENRIQSFEVEFRMKAKDGSWKWILGRGKASGRDPQGRAVRMIGTHVNITERKLAEEALRESENRLRFALENTNDGLWDVQMKTGETYLSPRGREMLGYRPDELDEAARNWSELIHPDDLTRTNEQLQEHLDGRAPMFEIEQRLRMKSGDWKWVLARGTVVSRDEDGTPLRMTGTHTDLTNQKKLEEQLLQSQKMEAIGTLAGGVAHDFNNILTAINGYGTLALMTMGKDDLNRLNIQQILESADRAAHLTRDLLLFSRKQPLDRKPVELNEGIRKLGTFLARVIGEDIAFKTVLSGGSLRVLADQHQIDQVLMNLATNARDAMPKGGVFTITTKQVALNKEFTSAQGLAMPGTYAMITVSDTGTGMDEETRQRIFEPFFTTKDVGKGTGLGMAVVYGIVKQHDGLVTVYSEPGQGATFRIYLPVNETSAAAMKAAVAEEPPGRGSETILLAEDDKMVRDMIVRMLENFGYTVITAIDGEDAVQQFARNRDRIGLLLFDLIMPKKTGKDAYDEIREMRPDIKVIFQSGYDPDMVRRKTLLEQNVPVLYKPVPMAALLKKLRSVLDEGKPAR